DGELFNLSFELLTPTRITSFEELATHSLMAKHTFSYNYSLLLLQKGRKKVDYGHDFVAFAPEFNQKMKRDYELAITDSINLDKTYLTLLPQPFSVDLAKRFSQRFKGSSFLNEKASKKVFERTAKEHKIIHIGTHAENNNINPELSRLIFAKDAQESASLDNNSLYTYEIYNYDLSSDLAILTACETGKPTYQAGEGMISLAHAFNYAGSESILTSLWEIDEKSSTEILSNFYENLEKGMDKDKALQQAKLAYLKQATGRTMAPQYWAGLVLMGDTAPITISTQTNWIWWILMAIGLSIALFLIHKIGYFRRGFFKEGVQKFSGP
ncbi:MAG: CHAT domain-containing protein, partial [Flavobacteriaceae bacterium]